MTTERYNNFAILIHWLMAMLIFGMFCLGWYMVDLPERSPERSWFFALHKSFGLTLALLVVVRLSWRFIQKPPVLPEHVEIWKQNIAFWVHSLLYLFMFLQPVSGYISSSFSGYKTRFWGIALPHWGWKDQHLNAIFTDIHVISSICLLLLILVHLLGVFDHVHRKQPEILRRMWPFYKSINK